MATLHVSESDFDAQVLESDQPVLVDFWAEWCAPCRALGPTIDALAGEYEGRAKVAKVNIDEAQGIAVKYGIQSIPSVLVFKNGEVVSQNVGLAPKERLAQSLDDALA